MDSHSRIKVGLLIVFGLFSVFTEGSCCGINWLTFGDHCFRFYPMKLTGHIARLRCLLEGSDLASIPNDSVLDFIAQRAANEEGDRFWVGLDTDDLDLMDGTSDAEKYSRVTPYMKGYSPEHPFPCFAFDGELVRQAPCTEKLGIICGHRIRSMRNQTVCNTKVGPAHSFVGEATGNCLFKAPGTTSKDKAEEMCEELGGHFVGIGEMVKDGLTAFYDHKVLANDGTKYWTDFVWNGKDVFWSFGNAVSGHYPVSLVRGTGDCITVQFNFDDMLQTRFYQTECQEEANVVCSQAFGQSFDPVPDLSDPRPEMLQADSPALECPPGHSWKEDSSKMYCYWETSFEAKMLSWADAEDFCQDYGGQLGSFHSIEDEKIGLNLQYGSIDLTYWIGLFLDNETETHKWSDGSPLDYTNWAPGQPDYKDKQLKCVAFAAFRKSWVSDSCSTSRWFICRAAKQKKFVLCSEIHCQNNEKCRMYNGIARCDCKDGYSGEFCEKDLCSPNPCQNGGVCRAKNQEVTCQCKHPFSGPDCSTIDLCTSNPCQNGGVCSVKDQEVTCQCKHPFSGLDCSVDTSRPNLCKNGGICVMDGNTSRCYCPAPFTGKFCEKNLFLIFLHLFKPDNS